MNMCTRTLAVFVLAIAVAGCSTTKMPPASQEKPETMILPDGSRLAHVVSKEKDGIGPNTQVATTWHCRRNLTSGKIAGEYPYTCELVPEASGVFSTGGPFDYAGTVAVGGATLAGGMALQRPDETEVTASGGSAGAGSTSISGAKAKADAGAGGGSVFNAPRPPRPPRWD